MSYWDSSALVPLAIKQAQTQSVRDILARGPAEIWTWWGSEVECASALARLGREGLAIENLRTAYLNLDTFAKSWQVVAPTPAIKASAVRALRVHALRAADALQLAAALSLTNTGSAAVDFVTLDRRLALAAEREGLRVVVPA